MRSEMDSGELNSPSDDGKELIADSGSETSALKQSQILSKVLSPAVRLFLRALLERVEDLQFSIEAGDRQLLSGCIKQVTVSARKAVYKGLCLSQVRVVGQGIRTNLGQVIRRRQPLRLLEEFPVAGEVLWYQADLNASLQSPLLANGLTEFLLILLKLGLDESNTWASRSPTEVDLQAPRIAVDPNRLTISATLVAANASPTQVVLRTGFNLINGNQLQLCDPERLPYLGSSEGVPLDRLDGVSFDLGSTVCLKELLLEAGQIRCQGRVMVTPEV
ncbi:MAG: DUF2993 domain-containing protein [Leptolyngbyaceae cyanobacterium HOT.MB2.61]|jgi:hypothetical protein|nr:DUF2993 domain-containing protein [Leptolyngbyaceae cyanobacterium HOT.MB2.61]